MRKQYDIDLPDVDANGIAEDQTTSGAGNLNLNGDLCDVGTAGQFDIGDTYTGVNGVQIGIESAGNLSGVTFTVTGQNQDGEDVTEDITGPNASTVESDTYWSQITQIAVDGAVGTNVEVGTVDEVVTRTVPVNYRAVEPYQVAIQGLSGTIDVDIDETFEETRTASPANWLVNSANQTADMTNALSRRATATRLKVNSYSSGAELQFHVNGV